MDNFDFIRELYLALKAEIKRFRIPAFILGSIILLVVMAVGITWKKQFTTAVTIEIDESNIIQPLLRGRAEFTVADKVEEAKEVIYSRRILDATARELGYINDDMSLEQIETVLELIKQNLIVNSSYGQGNIFFINYTHTDPAVSYNTLDVLVKNLVDYHIESQQAEGENAYGFINKRVDVYKSRLENAENELRKFRSGSVDVDEDSVQARINTMLDEILDLELKVQDGASKIETTKEQLKVESEYLKAQSVLYSLNQQASALETELSSLRMHFQDSYPDVVSIKSQLNDVNQRINRIRTEGNIGPRTFSSLESSDTNPELHFDSLRSQLSLDQRQYSANVKRLSTLRERLTEQHKNMEIVASNQAELSDLMREYNVTKEVYEEMLNRLQNAELSVAINAEGQGLTYNIIEPPVYPLRPTGLVFIHFLLAAPLLAIGGPIGLLLALILVDPNFRTMASLRYGTAGDYEILMMSPRYNTAFTERLFRKDMLLLSAGAVVLCIAYLGLAASGLKS